MKKKHEQKQIEVCADWYGLGGLQRMGTLYVTAGRGADIFSFEYDSSWLNQGGVRSLDPVLGLYKGAQYPGDRANFGLFLDSAPDRWGRVLMQRREAQVARENGTASKTLRESDYLLGVYDNHRMGALRFRLNSSGPFLDDNHALAAPPWASLRELEYASLQLERDGVEEDPRYGDWLRMLIAPGSSLGGARPKASVVDEKGHLWIAKFPSVHDEADIGAWEEVVHRLAVLSGIDTAPAQVRKFGSSHHTFLNRRFDRTDRGERLHFASAMTLLNRIDGEDASAGVSYLDMVEFILKEGANVEADLQQLWRRIIFFICVSNTDDHLRNHGFLLQANGWALAPAYDMNPVATGGGLRLNISEQDNAQDIELALSVADYFRLEKKLAYKIIKEVIQTVKSWRSIAKAVGISTVEQARMEKAFRVAESWKLK